jgi:hypothetical protein
MIFFSHNPDLVAEFIPKAWPILDKWGIFYFIFTLNSYWKFVKRDKLFSKKIKFKYENIKLNNGFQRKLSNV